MRQRPWVDQSDFMRPPPQFQRRRHTHDAATDDEDLLFRRHMYPYSPQ